MAKGVLINHCLTRKVFIFAYYNRCRHFANAPKSHNWPNGGQWTIWWNL